MIDARLKTFLTLCKEMNYRKTAEILHMTQPAVTQHIQFLEKEYGCKLFLYDHRSLSMTKEAEVLRAYAENVLYQENKAKEQIHLPLGRKLYIGATKTIGEFVMEPLVMEYLKREGNSVNIEIDNTENLLAMISNGKLDFALVEGFFDRKKYASKLYREEPFVGICEKSHPFAGKTIEFDDLWKEHLLVREEGSGTRDIFEQILKEHNHSISEFKKITGVGNFGLMLSLLKDLHGITFAYRALLNKRDDLREFGIKGCESLREFNYVYLDNHFAEESVCYFDSFRAEQHATDKELTTEFRNFIEDNGWDLVGIANPGFIDRMARPGRRPCDLFPSAKAVLIIGYGILDPIQRGWVHNGKSGKFYSFALLELDRRVHMIRRFLRKKGYNCYGGEAYGGALFNTGIRFGEAGASAGLGYMGKNNTLVTPKYGPRINLTYLATDAPLETVCIDPLPERECGSCTVCQKVCISGAILGDGYFHQRQCDAFINNRSNQKYYNDMVSQDCDKCIRFCPKGRVKWKNEPFSAEEREASAK